MFAEIILILLCGLIFAVHSHMVLRDKYKLMENFESIGPLYPIIGHFHLFWGKSTTDIYRCIMALLSKCKKTVTVWIFSKCIVVLNSPKDIQTVLNSNECLHKGTLYKLIMSGSSLLTAHPSTWRPHRRLINTCFSLQPIMAFVPQINKMSCDLVKDLEVHCDQGEIVLLDKIGIRLIESTLVNFFNQNLDAQPLNESYHLMHEVMYLLGERLTHFHLRIFNFYVERFLKIVPKDLILINRQLAILDEGRTAYKKKYMPEIEEDAKTISSEDQLRSKPDGFLKRAYRMVYHNRMSESEFDENLISILYGGTDSTNRTICNIILCLAMNPEIQENLCTELKLMLGDFELIDYETILQVEYLDRVIKESLRYLPTAPAIMRRTNTNIQLEHGIIPAGTNVVIPIETIHKSENIWGPNYNKFDPDHFLPENCEKRHPCSFIPFSYGPRNCIGYRYAQITLKITIANLVRTYKFGTSLRPENLSFGFGLTAILLNDYRISVTKRC